MKKRFIFHFVIGVISELVWSLLGTGPAGQAVGTALPSKPPTSLAPGSGVRQAVAMWRLAPSPWLSSAREA